jgi:hypothetical protein
VPSIVRNDPSYSWKRNGVLIEDVDINRDIAPKFEQALNNLAMRHLLCELRTVGSEWQIRKSTGSSKYLSFHAWGAAIDINPGSNEHYAQPTMSQPFVRAFMDTGLTWGGLWPDDKIDGMHFSLGW